MRILIPVLLLAGLAACGPKSDAPAASSPAPTPSPSALEPADGVPPATPLADYVAGAPGAYPFEVRVRLTPEAVRHLASINEQVTIAAMFGGSLKPGATPNTDGPDGINLGEDLVDIPPQADQVVKITGRSFEAARLGDIQGEPTVLINIFSARKAGPDNILDCGIFEGPISQAQAAQVDISCSLLNAPQPEAGK
jgi:hypothetical protein